MSMTLRAEELLEIARQNSPYLGSGMAHHLPTLYDLTKYVNAQRVVELGIGMGASSLAFEAGLSETGGQLTSVDLDPKAIGIALIRKLDLPVQIVINDALDFVPISTPDIVFIDDDHSYDHVVSELGNVLRYSGPRTLILMHDTTLFWGGPKRARDLYLSTGDLRLISHDPASWGLSILVKNEESN